MLRKGGSNGLDMVRAQGTLANTILQGRVEGEISYRRPARQWIDDVMDWAELE